MQRSGWVGVSAVIAGCAIASVYLLAPWARASVAPMEAPRKVDLTIYNVDFAMVRERREVDLATGVNRLALKEVSSELDPQSVLLRWTGSGLRPEIIGHSYDLGARDSQALLRGEVGRPVEIVRYGDNGRESQREKGTLLVAEAGRAAVVDVGGRLYVNPEGTLVLGAGDRSPAIPQLSVQAQSPSGGRAPLEIAYLTRGLSWSADYVATLSPQDDRLDLECYATVQNRTGIPYPESTVTLVAGSPNRAVMVPRRRALPAGGPAAGTPERDQRAFWSAVEEPQAIGDLEAYPLKNAATVQNDQLNRLLVFRQEGLRVVKDYSYRAPDIYSYYSPQQSRGSVTVGLAFRNTEAEALGKPMPPGALRVYDPDPAGRLRYAGAAQIPATPKGSKVAVTLGNAFDLTAAYRTISSKRVGKRRLRKEVEIRLENGRPAPVKVRVLQCFGDQWAMASSSHKWTKLDSRTVQWAVNVLQRGQTVRFAVDLVE